MRAHADYLTRTHRRDSVRINVAAEAALERDRCEFPEAFREYERWHRDHHVALLRVDQNTALSLARLRHLQDATDWSLWLGEVALAWEYTSAGLRLRLSFVGDHTYRRCYGLLQDLLDVAVPLSSRNSRGPST